MRLITIALIPVFVISWFYTIAMHYPWHLMLTSCAITTILIILEENNIDAELPQTDKPDRKILH